MVRVRLTIDNGSELCLQLVGCNNKPLSLKVKVTKCRVDRPGRILFIARADNESSLAAIGGLPAFSSYAAISWDAMRECSWRPEYLVACLLETSATIPPMRLGEFVYHYGERCWYCSDPISFVSGVGSPVEII